MPSRELRRHKRKTKSDAADIEKTLPAEQRKRHPVLYTGSIILLVIIVVAFVGGPLVGGVGGGKPIVFGTYGGEEITYVQGNYLARQAEILSDQLKNSADLSYEWQAYQVWKGAYDRAVVRTAILQDAQRSGVYISDNAIDSLLLTTGPYMEGGVFSESRYRNTSNSERFRYRQLYRDELTHSRYMQDVLHNGFFSTGEADFFKGMAADERSFFYVIYAYKEYPDSEVLAYARENESNFRKISLSRITVDSSRNEATAVRRQIITGVSTFENQARNYSSDGYAERDGDMGWREYYALAADFENISNLDEIFTLQKGEISDIYETSFGWVFYRVDETAVTPDFSQERELQSVRSYMERFERGIIEDHLLEQANTFATTAQNAGFGAAAEALGVELKKSASFPINYGNANYFGSVQGAENSDDLSGSAYDTRFFSMLFSLEENEISRPVVLDESVGVFQPAEQTILEDEEIEYLSDYYPYLAQQNILEDMSAHIMQSDDFEDNFITVFQEIFLGR